MNASTSKRLAATSTSPRRRRGERRSGSCRTGAACGVAVASPSWAPADRSGDTEAQTGAPQWRGCVCPRQGAGGRGFLIAYRHESSRLRSHSPCAAGWALGTGNAVGMIKQTPWAFPFLLRFSTNLQVEVPLEEGIEIYTALPAPSLGELEPDRIVDFFECELLGSVHSRPAPMRPVCSIPIEESEAQPRDRMKSAQPHRNALSI